MPQLACEGAHKQSVTMPLSFEFENTIKMKGQSDNGPTSSIPKSFSQRGQLTYMPQLACEGAHKQSVTMPLS